MNWPPKSYSMLSPFASQRHLWSQYVDRLIRLNGGEPTLPAGGGNVPRTDLDALALLRGAGWKRWPEAMLSIAEGGALEDRDLAKLAVIGWVHLSGYYREQDVPRILAVFAAMPQAGPLAPLPDDPGICYRGQAVGTKGIGLSWTPHRERAAYYARWRPSPGGHGELLSTVMPRGCDSRKYPSPPLPVGYIQLRQLPQYRVHRGPVQARNHRAKGAGQRRHGSRMTPISSLWKPGSNLKC